MFVQMEKLLKDYLAYLLQELKVSEDLELSEISCLAFVLEQTYDKCCSSKDKKLSLGYEYPIHIWCHSMLESYLGLHEIAEMTCALLSTSCNVTVKSDVLEYLTYTFISDNTDFPESVRKSAVRELGYVYRIKQN